MSYHRVLSISGLSILALLVSSCRAPVARADLSNGSIETMLREFHHRAAVADFDGYFDLFHPSGVFLGTDATERWSVAEFKDFARPHFQREPAWVFTPKEQQVTIASSGEFAWFEEVLESESYGECRGTGVVVRVDDGWKIGQYNLTVPIPNDLLREFVERIRGVDLTTRIIAVRHSEKQQVGDDPLLTAVGSKRAAALATVFHDVPIDTIFATGYRRTQLTVNPIAAAKDLSLEIVEAGEFEKLAERIQREHRGQTVMYAGHSNTVPQFIRALGVSTDLVLHDSDYDNIFVVTLRPGAPATLLRFHLPVPE